MKLFSDKRKLTMALIGLVIVLGAVFGWAAITRAPREVVPSFEQQACALDPEWLLRTQRGYFEPRSGQIALLPRTPAYMASAGGGWSHSGPWPYLQDVPLVFYGPGIIEEGVVSDRPVTTADVAPTIAGLLKGRLGESDGQALTEVIGSEAQSVERPAPKLILTIVWDGGGWNTLDLWDESWPNLQRMMDEGVSFTEATAGSSPSVTPAVHSTLGTGVFPDAHGITGVPVRDERGEVVDSFLKGESSRFLQATALAELWDEQNGNRAEVGMLGYEPWHLGMIGQGAERPGGDKDDALWLEVDTNEWITNDEHYTLPGSVPATEGLDEHIEELDSADGQADGKWRENVPLDDPGRTEETPAFVSHHVDVMLEMIEAEGYGRDDITDLLFTNFKQIDRVGHYFNMDSEYVNDVLVRTDEELGRILGELDRIVGEGEWVVVLTADHGQQPDAEDIDAYGISQRAVETAIRQEFGDVVRAVWPTEVFLLEDAMEEQGVTVTEIARFLGGHTLSDNQRFSDDSFTGRFEPQNRLFDLAVPADMLSEFDC